MTIHITGSGEPEHAIATGPAGAMLADIMAAFAAEQADLDAGGVPGGVAAPGSSMPDGELLDVQGVPTTLAQVRAGRPAVVVFYRGAWCPYCNLALRTYQAELMPALAERGVELIAVSPQKPDGSLTMAETNKLTFSVVSDPGNQLASALGILTGPEPGALSTQWSTRRQGRSTSKIGGRGGGSLPAIEPSIRGHLVWRPMWDSTRIRSTMWG